MYASVVKELKNKINNDNGAVTEDPKTVHRMSYDNVSVDSVPVIPPRKHPPVPKPRLIPSRPAPEAPRRNQEFSNDILDYSSLKPESPDSEVPTSLPVWYSDVQEETSVKKSFFPATLLRDNSGQSCLYPKLPDSMETGIPPVLKEEPPHLGWVIPPESQTSSRRHSLNDPPSHPLPAEPDEVTPGCVSIRLGAMFGAACKKTTLAIRSVKKRLEPSPQPLRRTASHEESLSYAVSSELLRELASAESSSSNGQYAVSKDLLTELLMDDKKSPIQHQETRQYAVSGELLRELGATETCQSKEQYAIGKELITELLATAEKPPPPTAPPLDLIV